MKFNTVFQSCFTQVGHVSQREPRADEVTTDPSYLPECDIHNIIRGFTQNGQLSSLGMHDPNSLVFEDSTNFPDFEEAQNFVARVGEEFMRLPSDVRSDFGNDPTQFVNFMRDPKDESMRSRLFAAGYSQFKKAEPKEIPVVKIFKETDVQAPEGK